MSEDVPAYGVAAVEVAPTIEELSRTAFHEAGHAVLHIALTLGCEGVTIEPDYSEMTAGAATHGGEWGRPATKPGEEDDDTSTLRMFAEEAFCTRHAIMCYAGAEAVRRLDPSRNDWRDGADGDYRQAINVIDQATGGDIQSTENLNAYAMRRTEILVENYWPEIEAVAQALIEARSLTGEDVRRLFRDSIHARPDGRLMGW